MQDPHARDHAHVVDHVGRVPRVRAHTPAHGDRDRAHRPDGGPARPRPHHPIHAGSGKEARMTGGSAVSRSVCWQECSPPPEYPCS
ncbi:hypothetical protein BLIJ_1321 [Bifidobacterium longum subsp. infantis ATCC 15697 = JCM 1222 = DSM 20088]|nr:hypothetical protein BLIJ_1321 [Bifidobacterium longum subsp. infantis ATCC 15697 = JCM 1222 = DSM 20088]